ncbi:hypothetical protein J0H58_33445 [bacterium]|nr:hypothetical protein [bacterium]
MRMTAVIPAAVAAVLLAGQANPQDPAPASSTGRAPEPGQTVKELQKERIATLRRVADAATRMAQNGRLEVWEAVEDRMTLLRAEAEAAEKEADRVPLYTKALDSLAGFEALAKARFEAGRGSELSVLKVRAKRLEVEISLERAKEATAPARP